jgi:hypothetical protein
MAKLSAADRKRLEELRAKLLDEKGDYREDADFEELQELAKLEAIVTDTPEPKAITPEEQVQPQKKELVFVNPITTNLNPKTKVPKIIKPWIKRGYDYYGVDEHGAYILWNNDEGMFYRLNRDPNFVDALGEGLTAEYLGSLR